MNPFLSPELTSILQHIKKEAQTGKRRTGFFLGNTRQKDQGEFYFTPLRHTPDMVVAGMVLFSETLLLQLLHTLDGQVDYLFVDAERKNFTASTATDDLEPLNQLLRGSTSLKKSKLVLYKGNDLAFTITETIDNLRMMKIIHNDFSPHRQKTAAYNGNSLQYPSPHTGLETGFGH